MARWGPILASLVFIGLAAGCVSPPGDAPGSASVFGIGRAPPEPIVTATPTATAGRPGVVKAALGGDRGPAADSARALMASATPGASAYKVGPLDVLDVSVFKVPELSKSVQVADVGTVSLPLAGEVAAAGRTAREIEQDLIEKLGKKYLRDPQVTVFVREYNSQRITVEGAVKKPGVFPYKGRTTLLQAIAMAEGLDVISDTNVIVFRTTSGGRAAARFDLTHVRSGAAGDPPLEAGDVVVVQTSALKEVFQNLIKAAPLAGIFALL